MPRGRANCSAALLERQTTRSIGTGVELLRAGFHSLAHLSLLPDTIEMPFVSQRAWRQIDSASMVAAAFSVGVGAIARMRGYAARGN
jgi:hypothetical protein